MKREQKKSYGVTVINLLVMSQQRRSPIYPNPQLPSPTLPLSDVTLGIPVRALGRYCGLLSIRSFAVFFSLLPLSNRGVGKKFLLLILVVELSISSPGAARQECGTREVLFDGLGFNHMRTQYGMLLTTLQNGTERGVYVQFGWSSERSCLSWVVRC